MHQKNFVFYEILQCKIAAKFIAYLQIVRKIQCRSIKTCFCTNKQFQCLFNDYELDAEDY